MRVVAVAVVVAVCVVVVAVCGVGRDRVVTGRAPLPQSSRRTRIMVKSSGNG